MTNDTTEATADSIDEAAHFAEPDDFGADDTSIADLLASLSQPSDLPDGPGERPSPFSADEVDFRSGDWLQKVISVQAWLCLDAPLSRDASPQATAESLFSQVAPGKPLHDMVTLTDFPQLTDLGAQRLEAFLSQADALRTTFTTEIDEGQSKRSAFEHWQEEWEEWGSQSKRQPGRIIAEVDTWKIKDFKGYAEEGGLQLNPSYQRDVVWSTSESQKLIESVLLGIPLPSVILTKDANEEEWQIVDGKQRLTAILRFIGRHPKARQFAETCVEPELLHANFKQFARKNQIKRSAFAEHFLPFALPRYPTGHPLNALSGKYYYEIKESALNIGGQPMRIKRIFETEDAQYRIPVILYRDTQIQDIHHVFGLYNKQGRKLNAEELRNAVYHHLYLTRLLLFLSGDRNDNGSRERLARFLPEDLATRAGEIGSYLETCNFGLARFKRTKVLSWACALMAHLPNKTQAGAYSTPSTATHINSLLDCISDKGQEHALYQTDRLTQLTTLLCDAITFHEAAKSAWHPNFKNKEKLDSKWDELSFVASLIACAFLVLAGRNQATDEDIDRLRALTQNRRGPKKSQNKTQWGFICWTVDSVLDFANADRTQLGDALQALFGSNPLPMMAALAAEYAGQATS
jgi:hypothetical protein